MGDLRLVTSHSIEDEMTLKSEKRILQQIGKDRTRK
jgi:hypothetical protein